MSGLVEELKPRLEQISVLYRLFRSGVASYRDLASSSSSGATLVPAAQQAAGLLADMYDTMLECDVLGEQQHYMVRTKVRRMW